MIVVPAKKKEKKKSSLEMSSLKKTWIKENIQFSTMYFLTVRRRVFKGIKSASVVECTQSVTRFEYME